MAKRKSGRAVNGWIAIDKPVGMGSTDVVNKVRWLFNAKKAGHGGTLDPMATGVLPIALGEATKAMPYALNANKSYAFEVLWGTQTDSLDADGTLVATCPKRPTQAQIESVLAEFIGDIDQVPPKVSALKVDGQRAYELARAGTEFTLAARPTKVLDLRLLAHKGDTSKFQVSAIKGFYVRALARDIAQRLGMCCHLIALRRLRSGPFVTDDCVTLEFLSATGHIADRDATLLPVDRVLDDIPALDLGSDAARQLRNGQSIAILRKSLLDQVFSALTSPLGTSQQVLVKNGDALVGIGQFEKGRIKPLRLFNL